MPQYSYRGNLSAATFPLTLAKSGRSVIMGLLDQNFDRRVDPAGDTTKNVGIPQAIYLENVLPTYDGYQSLGFVPATNNVPTIGGAVVNCSVKMPVKDSSSGFAFGAQFIFQFYNTDVVRAIVAEPDFPAYGNAWSVPTVPVGFKSPQTSDDVFWAHSQGRTFCLIIDTVPVTPVPKLYELTGVAPVVFTDVTAAVTGMPASGSWRSIAGTYNYLVINTFDAVYWSSLVNPLDFVASLVTGAGSQAIGANLTWINFLMTGAVGFYCFTRNNIVVAQYTGNRAYPWRFVPVENSAVVMRKTDVVSSVEADDIFVHTVKGQVHHIQGKNAEQIIPDVTDYLERDVDIDTLTWATGLFTTAKSTGLVNTKLQTRLWFVCERYLIISYNIVASHYQDALVFDIMLRRLGKIKTPHTHIYEDGVGFSIFDAIGAAPYVFNRVSTDIHETWAGGTLTHDGKIVFGNFSFKRGVITALEQIDIEATSDQSIAGTKLFEVKYMGTTDDSTYTDVVVPYLFQLSRYSAKYLLHKNATSFRIGFRGQFRISMLSLIFHQDGNDM